MRASLFALNVAVALAVLSACGPDAQTPPAPPVLDGGTEPTVMADFSLEDRNPGSATFGEAVSPRAHQGAITGWYFSHTT